MSAEYYVRLQTIVIDKINNFFLAIKEHPIELYSEFGLQHELALFLRTNYSDLSVKLEYPVTKLFNPMRKFVKREMDIFVETQDGKRFTVELKMPKDDCGAPIAMYQAIRDVKFLEQLREINFNGCYSILITERQAFWQAPRAKAGIYHFFNGDQVNITTVELDHLPNFLHRKGPITLVRNYQGQWQDLTDSNDNKWKYYVLDI